MHMKTVESSNIKAIGHEGDVLHIQFKNGKTYSYAGVTPEKHADLLAAESATKHFNAHIRPHHACTKLD